MNCNRSKNFYSKSFNDKRPSVKPVCTESALNERRVREKAYFHLYNPNRSNLSNYKIRKMNMDSQSEEQQEQPVKESKPQEMYAIGMKRSYSSSSSISSEFYEDSKRLCIDTDTSFCFLNQMPILEHYQDFNDEPRADKCKVAQNKNSIQLLYEVKKIQNIQFEMVCAEGPAHKPLFKFRLTFSLLENIYTFHGEGSAKKLAKSMASLKAMYNLINLTHLFSLSEIEYIKNCLENEVKSLNLNVETIEQMLKELPEPQSLVKTEPNDETIQTEISVSLLENKDNLFSFDSKTQEILKSGKLLSILSHLIPTGQHSFELCEEHGLGHSKNFKINLKIAKSIWQTSSSSWLCSLSIDELRNSISTNFQRNESILINETDTEYVFTGSGMSKKIAKSNAAQLALESLFGIKLRAPESDVSIMHEDLNEEQAKIKDFADNLGEFVKQRYNELLKSVETQIKTSQELEKNLDELTFANQSKLRGVYAAIVQAKDFDFSSAKLICLTTGTKCIAGEFMSQTGACLNDCHAEILAVRLLRKYFYKQLKEFWTASTNGKVENENIFQFVSCAPNEKKKISLKAKITFHLFISTAPCGDGRIFSIQDKESPSKIDAHPNRKVRGLLRTKIESGEGTIPINNRLKLQTWDNIILGEPLRTMSCSDKLCKYNVIGLQGALLSTFVEPIYFKSTIIGSFYHKDHLARALYSRVSEQINYLPEGFRVNKPVLSSITNSLSRHVAKSSNKAIIWSSELKNKIEIISCREGKTIEDGKSEICKQEMFKNWHEIYKIANGKETFGEMLIKEQHASIEELSYSEVKNLAKRYQEAKLILYEAFKQNHLGLWLTKPFEQDSFIL